ADVLAGRAGAATRPVRPRAGAASDPAWTRVPAHRHHVLVCRGPRCSMRGSAAVSRALGDALAARGLGDDDVLVTQTGCLYPCDRGPVAVVHPDDAWYGALTPEAAGRLVDEHLRAGRPLQGHRLERGGGAP
ncbi:(2Fe-2S) ferredoxin domain-containing protein, partial [Patulibacter sp. S7RM1-6]